jgi:hypothetical protein
MPAATDAANADIAGDGAVGATAAARLAEAAAAAGSDEKLGSLLMLLLLRLLRLVLPPATRPDATARRRRTHISRAESRSTDDGDDIASGGDNNIGDATAEPGELRRRCRMDDTP